MSKKDYRVRNWNHYNKALVNRGQLTIWFSREVLEGWYETGKTGKRGRPIRYKDLAIECGLSIKALYRLPFRATQGMIQSIIELLNLDLKSPDYSLLCKRQKTVRIEFVPRTLREGEKIHLLVDTTGLKILGEGEWKVRQHGWSKKRLWRKLHIAINADDQIIEACELTDLGFQDADGLEKLIAKIASEIDGTTGDGAYDQYKVHKLSWEKKFKLITPPNRKAKLTKECTGKSTRAKHTPEMLQALKGRDEFIERIREVSRKEWKKEVDYHRRSLVETAMFRIKTLLGNKLTTRRFEHQKIEALIWCKIVNKMTSLGMPHSLPI